MCLILIAIDSVPGQRLVVLGNRDEFHERASAPARPWDEDRRVVGGRDLVAGGSWLAARSDGRFAVVTNLRSGVPASAPRSRGWLVRDFVVGAASPVDFLRGLAAEVDEYGPFNLIVGDADGIHAYDGSARRQHALEAGVHVVSNGGLTARWPKTERLLQLFDTATDGTAATDDALLAILTDEAQPDDGALPDTGVGLALERMLAPVFIRGARYGTRASSLVGIDDGGTIRFDEARHGPDGIAAGRDRWRCDGDGGTWEAASSS